MIRTSDSEGLWDIVMEPASYQPSEYYNACKSLGIRPEEDDPLYDLYHQGWMDSQRHYTPRISSLQQQKPKTKPKRQKEPNQRQIDLYKFTEQQRINPYDSFSQIDQKREILIKAGYKTLTGPGGSRIPIYDAKDERVGQMFRETYKRVENYFSTKQKS